MTRVFVSLPRFREIEQTRKADCPTATWHVFVSNEPANAGDDDLRLFDLITAAVDMLTTLHSMNELKKTSNIYQKWVIKARIGGYSTRQVLLTCLGAQFDMYRQLEPSS